eukprot:6191608-Pleurochrysis_carterae.AAC.3
MRTILGRERAYHIEEKGRAKGEGENQLRGADRVCEKGEREGENRRGWQILRESGCERGERASWRRDVDHRRTREETSRERQQHERQVG